MSPRSTHQHTSQSIRFTKHDVIQHISIRPRYLYRQGPTNNLHKAKSPYKHLVQPCPEFKCTSRILDHASTPPSTTSPANRSFLTRRLLGVLLERVCGVGAQSTLGVVRVLLGIALLRSGALVVDVGCCGAGLGVGLVLRLRGLTACVGCGHDGSVYRLVRLCGKGARGGGVRCGGGV